MYEQPDPRKAFYVFATGSKDSGKSYYCRAWFDAYPFDKLVIDPTHDVRKDFRREGIEFVDLGNGRSEEHTSELQSHSDLVCRLLLEKKKVTRTNPPSNSCKIL